MSSNELQQDTGCRKETRDPAALADEVGDELMFHFRSLVDDKLAAGLSFDDAWKEAEGQFGPMRRYDMECRMGQIARHGRRRRLAAVSCFVVAVISGWFVFQSHRNAEQGQLRDEIALLRQEQAALKADAVRGGYARQIAGGFDLTGSVVDDSGHPLENVTVLIIRKTWPGGGYRQEAFTVTTNDRGRFVMPEFVPSDDQYGIQVSALKEGFAFQSVYQLKDKQPIARPDPIALRLEHAAPVTLVVRDGAGHPLANVAVIPSARKTPGGNDYMVYFHGSEPVRATTDATGRVCLNCFLAGDQAGIFLRIPGEDWSNREFVVAGENQVVDVATNETKRDPDGS